MPESTMKRFGFEIFFISIMLTVFMLFGIIIYDSVVNYSDLPKRGVVVGYNYTHQYTIIEAYGYRYAGERNSGIMGHIGDTVTLVIRMRNE